MIVKLLTEHHLEFLSLKGGCRGSCETTHVKMPHCSKSHALAQLSIAWRLQSIIQITQMTLKSTVKVSYTVHKAISSFIF